MIYRKGLKELGFGRPSRLDLHGFSDVTYRIHKRREIPGAIGGDWHRSCFIPKYPAHAVTHSNYPGGLGKDTIMQKHTQQHAGWKYTVTALALSVAMAPMAQAASVLKLSLIHISEPTRPY